MARIRRCRKCGQPVKDDGYGELVHEASNRYGCDPDTPRGETYLVAE